jgi:hypothetical protein
MFRRGAACAVVAALLVGPGCFGTFQLTRKVYKFNQDLDQDKFVRWLAFLGLNIIPIYGIATFVDVIFANSVEFWTGKNPINTASTRTIEGPDGQVATLRPLGEGRVEVTVRNAQNQSYQLVMAREGESVAAYDMKGALLGRALEVDGELTLLRTAAAH